ncbi:MAG: glycosyl hydrolase family 18 protein [candidate division FCPU426 bacterium]
MRTLSLLVSFFFVLSGVKAIAAENGGLKAKGNFSVAGWLVYWDPDSMKSFEENAALIDRVYPEWYVIDANGMPVSIPDNDPKVVKRVFSAKKKQTMEIARRHQIKVFSMIVNYDNSIGDHSPERVHKFLYDNNLRKKHIALLVKNALRDGADGIDIDYENLASKDAAPFAAFMAELRKVCDKNRLYLAAALAPKTSDQGTWEGNQAHDYKALAPSLDLLRPMTYDEHWATGDAGPVSSPQFTEATEAYAVTAADPSKIELGMAAYGYDWAGKKAVSVSYSEFEELLKRTGAEPQRDPVSSELMFRYEGHEVWFCDAQSYHPKYDLIKKYKLAGLAMWRFGSEDPAFWDDLKLYKFAKDWE